MLFVFVLFVIFEMTEIETNLNFVVIINYSITTTTMTDTTEFLRTMNRTKDMPNDPSNHSPIAVSVELMS